MPQIEKNKEHYSVIYKIGISILIFLSIGFYTYTEFNQNKLRGKITESVVNFTQIKLTDDFIIKESKKIDKSIFPIRLKIPIYEIGRAHV